MIETCYEYMQVSKKNFNIGNYELAYKQASRCQDYIENLFNVSSEDMQIELLSILFETSKIIAEGADLVCCNNCSKQEVKKKILEYHTISQQDAYATEIREAALLYKNKLKLFIENKKIN